MLVFICFFFFKQKTAYEMRISDWSSDVCSSDLFVYYPAAASTDCTRSIRAVACSVRTGAPCRGRDADAEGISRVHRTRQCRRSGRRPHHGGGVHGHRELAGKGGGDAADRHSYRRRRRSEEKTSELQSLMRTSYSDFCLKK